MLSAGGRGQRLQAVVNDGTHSFTNEARFNVHSGAMREVGAVPRARIRWRCKCIRRFFRGLRAAIRRGKKRVRTHGSTLMMECEYLQETVF